MPTLSRQGSLLCVPDCGLELDMDAYVERAQALFEQLCPGEPFLPPEGERAMAVAPTEAPEDPTAILDGARIPQVADTRWFEYLGGIVIRPASIGTAGGV